MDYEIKLPSCSCLLVLCCEDLSPFQLLHLGFNFRHVMGKALDIAHSVGASASEAVIRSESKISRKSLAFLGDESFKLS